MQTDKNIIIGLLSQIVDELTNYNILHRDITHSDSLRRYSLSVICKPKCQLRGNPVDVLGSISLHINDAGSATGSVRAIFNDADDLLPVVGFRDNISNPEFIEGFVAWVNSLLL
jgi:hypothetical protein